MSPPFLTRDLPPITGRIRAEPGDFAVEEVLAYEPGGEGTHLWLGIEKTGLTTFEAVRRIARALGRREEDIGYAGLKDRHAVTRQTFSIEFATEAEAAALDVPGVRVVTITRHRNKLKLGHLAGNRFRIRVRDVGPQDADVARRALEVLVRRGVPNRFGPQRFGHRGVTPQLGRKLLAGDLEGFLRTFAGVEDDTPPAELLASPEGRDPLVTRAVRAWSERGRPERGVRVLPRRLLSLCTAALQAEVFNRVLAERLDTLDEVSAGDVAFLHRNGACFLLENAAAESPRAAAFEISPSGPLPGPACLRPAGAQAELEARVLADLDVTHETFAVRGPWAQKGGRRPLRVPLGDPGVEAEPAADGGGAGHLVLSFRLPRGSFATSVLEELLKTVNLAPPTDDREHEAS